METKNIKRQGEALIATVLHARSAKRGIPLAGNFELTARCNFNCKMCYVHENQDAAKELSADEWIALGREARDKGMVFLLLTGGEPLIRPDFGKIYTELRKMGLMISINTNGSLLNQELLDIFKQYPPTRINVSLYGGNYETYKNLCGVAAHDVVMTNILKMKEMGLSVKINCTITPYNVQDLEEIYNFGKIHNIPVQATTYMYPPVRINGKKYGEAPARFSAEEAAHYMLRCREQYLTPEQLADASAGIIEEESDCTGDVGGAMNCRAGRGAFWVTWDGRMLPCGMFPTDGYDIRKFGFEKAWEEVKKETIQVVMPAECTGCSKRERCGACAAACLAESGDTRIKPEYICKMTHLQDQMTKKKYGKES